MDGADEVPIGGNRIVQLKEMGNGCYVELYEEADDNARYSRGQPEGYSRIGSQFLLKPKPVFRSLEVLPVPTELKLRLGEVLTNAQEWLDEGEGSEKDWFEDTSRADKLLHYVSGNWYEDDPGILRDVAEALAKENVMLCNRSRNLFTLGEWGRPTGSYVATVAADEGNRCPNCGAPKSEFWECIKSSRRTRVPNTYKCQNCGKTKKGITTG